MVRILHLRPGSLLAAEDFETNHYLRFDFEQPKEIIVIPTKFRTKQDLEEAIVQAVAKIKQTREKFVEMGDQKILYHSIVSDSISTAEKLSASLQFILKRYYFNREEGLRVSQQREYAAVEDAGMSRPFKKAAITIRYRMEVRSKCFAYKVSRRCQKLEDAVEKLRRYSQEALHVSGGGEPNWGVTLP
ncbi:hypothetical protein IL306_010666 [Fusarium sp. DS 682]|nr:hypothetical protein IL306_010666 [Fusarium sp. DS 682]